jgi:hypothetical protein
MVLKMSEPRVFLDRKRVSREFGAELRLLQRGESMLVQVERDEAGDFWFSLGVSGTPIVDKQES